MKNGKENDDEKKKMEKDEKVSGSKDEMGSTNAAYGSQNSKSTQTKPHGTGQMAASTRSSPSFVNRTLTVIQDEVNQEGQEGTSLVASFGSIGVGRNIARSEESHNLSITSTAGPAPRRVPRPVESRSTQANMEEPPARSVHQVLCARSRHGTHVCKGSANKSGAAQRGCCVDDVRVTADGVVVGCCGNEPRADNAPTVYQCRKATGFPDSVYPTSSGLFCCHGTWRQEVPPDQAADRAGTNDMRSFVGMCCSHAPPLPKLGDEDSAELTTAVVELETVENGSLDTESDEAEPLPK